MDLSPAEFAQLRGLVHRLCGLALTEEKTYLLRHRLGPVARAAGCPSFAAFLARLAGPDAAALRAPIIEAVTTKETAFFRDRHPFDTFRRVLLPRLGALVRRRRAERRLARARTWCAGVATGQEAYSIAMLIDDYLAAEGRVDPGPGDFPVLATDISARVLEVARAGRYSDREVRRGVTAPWVGRYFRQAERGWVVDARLRERIEFRQGNLLDPFNGLAPVDVIFCRNVLIYFDEAARRHTCERFADLLPPGGLLVLGAVENLYGISSRFIAERLGPTLVYRRL
jgi:chemotaxis protein methyltransferase CheR